MAKAAACLALLVGGLVPLGARAGSAALVTVRIGDSVAVPGANLLCASTRVEGGAGFSCLQRDPARVGAIRPDSMGIGISSGRTARVSLVVVDETGRVGLGWVRRQPAHATRGAFPTASGRRTFSVVPGDRLALAGTNLLCVVDARAAGPAITCAEVETGTFEPIAGTYAVAADANRVEVERVTRTGPFRLVAGHSQPWRSR